MIEISKSFPSAHGFCFKTPTGKSVHVYHVPCFERKPQGYIKLVLSGFVWFCRYNRKTWNIMLGLS